MSKKSNSLSKLSSDEKNNLCKVTFFFRHINDLDFSLPLLLFATKPNVIFYQKIDVNDPRINLLIENNVNIESLNNLGLEFIERIKDLSVAFFLRFNFSKFANFLESNINLLACILLRKAIHDLQRKKNFFDYSDIFCFDHTSCFKSKLLISQIRSEIADNRKINIISLPHGADIFKNRMIDYDQVNLESDKQDYNHFDHIVCNDLQHFNSLEGTKTILKSLRYTKKWQIYISSLAKNHHDQPLHKSQKNVLFLLSKFEGGVNINEVQRALKIINNFKNIKLKIKPHPRGLMQIKKLNIYNSEIVCGDVQSQIISSDCVINIQSNAVFDAFLQKKPVIFPSFMTSNDWLEDIKNQSLVAETPDDFFQYIQDLSNGNLLKTPNYEFVSWDELHEKWINFFSSFR